MRTPIRAKGAPQQQVSTMQSYSAPVGGWNARDALASMKPTDAIELQNWYPRPSYVEFRGGHASHATAMTGNGKTLMPYNKLTGTNELYCATSSGIYNVTSAGAVGASVLARTNGKHQHERFGDGTSNWLIAVNGTDKPAYYDGTTWTAVTNATTPALTGYTANAVENFIGVNIFKGRVFFIEKNSLSFWYLAAGAAGGGVTEFDLSGEFKLGGYLMAMATWTRDGGSGVDDFAVFFSSEGEVAVYQGTNPSSATNWSKVGSYTIGRPLGRRCVIQYGGDCVVITENGTFPLSALLQSGDERNKFALSYKIQDAFTAASRLYGTVFGWRAITFPKFDAMLINVPQSEDGVHQQYVMNMVTKAWCRFTGWNAEDFGILSGELYFCKGTTVYKAWTGTADNGSAIDFYAKQAFQDFGDSRQKHVKLFMPFLVVDGSVAYGADIDVDFKDEPISGTVTYVTTAGSVWDTSLWDSGYWAASSEIVRQWSSPSEWQGRWISGKVKITSNVLTVQWMGASMLYEPGAGI